MCVAYPGIYSTTTHDTHDAQRTTPKSKPHSVAGGFDALVGSRERPAAPLQLQQATTPGAPSHGGCGVIAA